ncbi:hypothetical protein LTR73_009152 [Friedmanniomyces endolithicus]|nr:hypothetical protein LTR73_009152 [Friedmanniomyces endolithicus]
MGNLTKYCILLYWPDSTIIASQWFPTVLAIIFLLCGGLFNVYLTRKFAILEGIMLTIHWAAWIAIVVTLWVTSPRGKASEVLFTFTNSGGWRSGGVATLAGTWLVVPDNPDDVGFLLEPLATMSEAQPTQRRIDYVPTCDHRAVIITTRSKRKALRLVYESEMVDVLPMGEGEAETLLESKLGRSSRDTRELCREEMEQSRSSRTSLLRREVPLPSRDAEATSLVLMAWQISFEYIYDTRRSAAELLSLMSFCDALAIQETLLRVKMDESNEGSDRTSSSEEDVVVLRSFSFVSHTASAQEWEMHRLVQDATLVWLEGHGRQNEIHERFAHRAYTSFPTGHFNRSQRGPAESLRANSANFFPP